MEEIEKIENVPLAHVGTAPAAEQLSDYDGVLRFVPISLRAAITEAWPEVEFAAAMIA